MDTTVYIEDITEDNLHTSLSASPKSSSDKIVLCEISQVIEFLEKKKNSDFNSLSEI